MTTFMNIKRLILTAACAFTLCGSVATLPAQAEALRSRNAVIQTARGDGQETHGGPRRTAGPVLGDGMETHGGPK